jgi:hypothetical protein
VTLSLSLKAKGNYPLPWYIFAPTDITSCYHNFRLQTRVFARMDPSGARGKVVSAISSGATT